MRPDFETVVEDLDLLAHLAVYRPVMIGTPPLGIATEDSDIDIACTASDFEEFGHFVGSKFGHLQDFAYRHLDGLTEPAALASFFRSGWRIELFCQHLDTADQWGVRHFRVEKRLLALEPKLRPAVQRLKRLGFKTEPAFAKVLRLPGNPYEALLLLESESDEALREVIDGIS